MRPAPRQRCSTLTSETHFCHSAGSLLIHFDDAESDFAQSIRCRWCTGSVVSCFNRRMQAPSYFDRNERAPTVTCASTVQPRPKFVRNSRTAPVVPVLHVNLDQQAAGNEQI